MTFSPAALYNRHTMTMKKTILKRGTTMTMMTLHSPAVLSQSVQQAGQDNDKDNTEKDDDDDLTLTYSFVTASTTGRPGSR